MTRLVVHFALVLVYLTALPAVAAQRSDGIAAVVNNDAITSSDVMERTRLIAVSSGMPDTPEVREKMRPQIIGNLIDERLMTQEAATLDITIAPQDIEGAFAELAGQNNMKPDQFRAALRSEGVNIKTLEDQIAAQLAWSAVVQIKIKPQVTVTENEINAALDLMRSRTGKTRYLVSEIFLPVEAPRDEPAVRELADRLTAQLVQGRVPFPRVARQFSQAAGAARGGDLGWVQEGQLPEELDTLLAQMKEGELSQPVRSLAGFHIILLRKKSLLDEASMPSREEVRNRLTGEQIERLQRRHLLDLKQAAFIERRV